MKRRKSKGKIVFACIILLSASFIYGYFNNSTDKDLEEDTKINIGVKKINNDLLKENVKDQTLLENKEDEDSTKETITKETQLVFKTYISGQEQASKVVKENIPNTIVGKDIAYFNNFVKNTYSDWQIESIDIYKAELFKKIKEEINDKYIIKEDNGHLGVYEILENGGYKLIEKTDIPLNVLSETDIGYIKNGIKKKTLDEIYSVLEDYSS